VSTFKLFFKNLKYLNLLDDYFLTCQKLTLSSNAIKNLHRPLFIILIEMKKSYIIFLSLILFFGGCDIFSTGDDGESVDEESSSELVTEEEPPPSDERDEVEIGNQVWKTQNLDVETFKNGDVIPEAKSDEEWERAEENNEPAWCYYDNDPENGKKYGKLYNHFAVSDTRGLCPTGWHVPSDEEWTRLETFLGRDGRGEKLKRGSTERFTIRKDIQCSNCASWSDEYKSKVACHECKDNRLVSGEKEYMGSGFYALPGGLRYDDGNFGLLGSYGYWWRSSSSGSNAGYRALRFTNGDVSRLDDNDRAVGFSVRCLRD